MQKQFRTRFFAATALLMLLASCSKTNKQGKMIPKDAGFVIHVDSRSLSEKINLAELKQMEWYKDLMAEIKLDTSGPDIMNKLRNNTQISGIDSLADFIFFGENTNADGMRLVFEGGLKDAKAFESLLKYLYPQGSASKDGELNMMPVEDKAIVTWNNEKFVIGIQSPGMGNMYGMGKDFGIKEDNDTASSGQLAAYCKKIYTLKDDENLSKNEKFSDLMKTDGDMHFWMNSEKLMGGSLQMGMLSMLKMDKLLEGNISTLTLNFEKGKISIKSKGYAGKELSALFSKYSDGSINTDMIKNIPSNNIVGVFAFHFKPEGLRELVKLTGMDGFLDPMIARQGFTLDDFVKANKGDIMISVSDFSVKKDSTTYKGFDGKMQTSVSTEPTANYFFAASISDKDAFNKLIRAGKEATGNGADEKLSYNSNGSYFALGDSPDLIAKFLAGGNKADHPFLSKISGKALGAYVDLQKIIKAFEPSAAKDSIDKQMWSQSMKIWEDATLTGGDYSGGGYNQLIEINLLDKNTNSLRQLFQYAMTMAKLEKEKTKKMDFEFSMSDTKIEEIKTNTAPPPPPAPAKKK